MKLNEPHLVGLLDEMYICLYVCTYIYCTSCSKSVAALACCCIRR